MKIEMIKMMMTIMVYNGKNDNDDTNDSPIIARL